MPAFPIIGQEQDPAVPAVPDSLQSAVLAELVPLVAELHLLVVQLLGVVSASEINRILFAELEIEDNQVPCAEYLPMVYVPEISSSASSEAGDTEMAVTYEEDML